MFTDCLKTFDVQDFLKEHNRECLSLCLPRLKLRYGIWQEKRWEFLCINCWVESFVIRSVFIVTPLYTKTTYPFRKILPTQLLKQRRWDLMRSNSIWINAMILLNMISTTGQPALENCKECTIRLPLRVKR